MKSQFQSSQIKKTQFQKLVTDSTQRRVFNSDKAHKTFKNIKEGVELDVYNCEEGAVPLADMFGAKSQLCLREFKVKMAEIGYLNQEQLNNLTSYLHKEENGFIFVKDFLDIE